jgi:septal ring factor EnvC (AmiA/AmiB activator)
MGLERRIQLIVQILRKSKFIFFSSSFLSHDYFSLQISKLEADVQRLNQTLEKQKSSEIQLRTQVTDLKNLRKDLEDLRTENNDLKTKFVEQSILLQ